MTNAISKFQNADIGFIMKTACGRIDDFIDRYYQFSLVATMKRKGNDDRVVLLDNGSYVNLHKQGKVSHPVRGSDGVIRTYIYDGKNGIYMTKMKTHLLAPHFHMVLTLWRRGTKVNWVDYWNNYSGKDDIFPDQSAEIRNELHTGNHKRNKTIKVPPSVYGKR